MKRTQYEPPATRRVSRPPHSPPPVAGVSGAWGETLFTEASFRNEAAQPLTALAHCPSADLARVGLLNYISMCESRAMIKEILGSERFPIRDCANAMRWMISVYAEQRTGFSITQALMDLANHVPRPDLTPAFFAEMIHLVRGLEGRALAAPLSPADPHAAVPPPRLKGRQAAVARSGELDHLWETAQQWMDRYDHGLMEEVQARRVRRRSRIIRALDVDERSWEDWHWQVQHVITDEDALAQVLCIDETTRQAIARARGVGIPFGVTPFYTSLMEDEGGQDWALRAQVLPPSTYVEELEAHRDDRGCRFDFMREADTSPVPLVTRRYPTIVILKPYNTCPQICVYCQRNWEIAQAMDPQAMAPRRQVERALAWIAEHPSISEVLVTGGDPLVMEDDQIAWLLDRLSAIPHIERIRLGSRTLVTLPMRFTDSLIDLLARYREPGRRDICLMTHIQHPYEINPAMVSAVDRVRRRGMSVYNQLVYTFYTSRRFEAVLLRRLLKLMGVDPYYTFNTKGKEETHDYRVPIARLLQEQKEEARLTPGTVRTDEPVFNVPRLGKNHLRAIQHHDLLTVLPDGSRVYEFHPWEKQIAEQEFYHSQDVPILTYLQRLAEHGEDPEDYRSIWYYF